MTPISENVTSVPRVVNECQVKPGRQLEDLGEMSFLDAFVQRHQLTPTVLDSATSQLERLDIVANSALVRDDGKEICRSECRPVMVRNRVGLSPRCDAATQ